MQVGVVLCHRKTEHNPHMLLHVLEWSAWSNNGTWGDQCHNRAGSDGTYFPKISSAVNTAHQPPSELFSALPFNTHYGRNVWKQLYLHIFRKWGNERYFVQCEVNLIRTPKCSHFQFLTFAFNYTNLLCVHSVFDVSQLFKKSKWKRR